MRKPTKVSTVDESKYSYEFRHQIFVFFPDNILGTEKLCSGI
jgi:hypothetical protein